MSEDLTTKNIHGVTVPAERYENENGTAILIPTGQQINIDEDSNIGKGTVFDYIITVANDVIIGRKCRIHKNIDIHTGSIIGNKCSIGEFSKVMPNVTIEDNVEIGRGCYILPRCTIGEGAEIGDGVALSRRQIIPAFHKVTFINNTLKITYMPEKTKAAKAA